MDIQVRPVRQGEIDTALTALLEDSQGDPAATADKLVHFKRTAVRHKEDLRRQIVVADNGDILFSCLFSVQPGRTAFVFVSPLRRMRRLGLADVSPSYQAVEALCRWAFQEGCTMLQVILEPSDLERIEVCKSGGFSSLTELVYLLLPIDPANEPPAGRANVTWETYTPQNQHIFKTVIAQSYQQSLDCPELEGIRDMEDILLGHQSAGEFDPKGWFLLKYQDNPAGVVLLARQRQAEAMELVYMGIVPQYRSRGLGGELLNKAIRWSRHCGARCLMLAVDSRNTPAYQLYARHGFCTLFRRAVLIRNA
jgi:mycothiol synthase